jgi:hypothetical protein
VLLERLISLIRKLGHFPVKNELKLERLVDSSFPNDKTFARLGGLGHGLAARVRDYCTGRTDYDDVLLSCADVPAPREAKLDENTDEPAAFGFFYLMKSGRYYKIGRSNAVGRREYELAIQLPEALKTIHGIQTDGPVGIEEYWHKRFTTKRKNGEWFDLDASDIKAFTRRKSFM